MLGPLSQHCWTVGLKLCQSSSQACLVVDGVSLLVQGGAKGTDERVLALMAWPSRRRLFTWREYLLVQGGAEDTVKRVLGLMVKYFLDEGHDVVRRRQLW